MLGTNELLTSFDAINVLAPHNDAPPAGWLHVDQTPLRPHFACLQGLVNLVDVSADTSGLFYQHCQYRFSIPNICIYVFTAETQ